MNRHKRYPPEVRERAVRLVLEHQENYNSQWAALTSIADKIGCTAETLRKWVRHAEVDQGSRPGVNSSERERIRELERENRELKRANEILRKASAFSPKRSSTANRRAGAIHRPTPGCTWGRADMQAIADRPVDVLRAQGQGIGPGTRTGPGEAGPGAV